MQRTGKKPMSKTGKRLLTVGIVLAVLAALLLPGLLKGKAPDAVLDLSDTTVLSRRNLEKKIAATGLVESAQRTKVYSTLSYTVKTVLVEEGDTVKAGDLLAELDSTPLQDQITRQELGMSATDRGSSQQVQAAQTNYNNFKAGIDQGLNTTLNSAKAQTDAAYDAYERACLNYERHVDSLGRGENASLLAAETALDNAADGRSAAKDALKAAEEATDEAYAAMKDAEAALEDGTGDESAYEQAAAVYETARAAEKQAEKAYSNARDAFEVQAANYNSVAASLDNASEDYRTAVDTAWKNYQDALTAQEAAEKAVQEQLSAYETALSNARANADDATGRESLRQLQADLEKTRITAPCDGIVTAVYAEEGASGAGLLFLIEDGDHLVVKTTVKGYDMGVVREGLPVLIRSEALEDAEFEGTLTKIAPAANKNAMGETDLTMGDPIFAAEVTILTENTGLKIGMEADLDYIVQQEEDVLTVPYEAVYRNEEGDFCVLCAEEQEDGTYLLQELPVEVGMDDDLDRAVSGEGLEEGLRIISDPSSYQAYLGQTLPVGTRRNGFMMGGGMG